MSGMERTQSGPVAVVTISNPGKRNAITREMWSELPVLLDRLAADPQVRVVILTGGDGDFSAGNNIHGLSHGADTALPSAGVDALAKFPKPVIAAIDGYCLGAGAELTLAADLRLATTRAQFGIPPANLGLVFPLHGLRLLVGLIGPAQAKRLIYTGERIDAAAALQIGLVDEAVRPGDLLGRAHALAERIASRSQLTIHAAKAMIRALEEGGDAVAATAAWRAEGADGPDLAEGRAAFADRREPRFTWNGRPEPELSTDRLLLRRFGPDDAPFVLALHRNPDLARFIPSNTQHDESDAYAWIQQIRSVEAPLRGWWCVTGRDGEPLGAVVLKPIRYSAGRSGDEIEIGWRFHADATGHGYATEAARAVADAAFADGLDRIIAVTDPANEASQAVCRRLGMRDAGLTDVYYDTRTELFESVPAAE